METSLDSKTVNLLRIAFSIMTDSKKVELPYYWFAKLDEHWKLLHNSELSSENCLDIYKLICDEFPSLSDNTRLRAGLGCLSDYEECKCSCSTCTTDDNEWNCCE